MSPEAPKLPNARAYPVHEWGTGRDQRDVQAPIDVCRILGGVVTIDVRDDGTVSVDTASEKVVKLLRRYRKRADRETLGGRQADFAQPIVEDAITPLKSRDVAVTARCSAEAIVEVQAFPHGLEHLEIRGDQREMSAIT
jgi:hypothetical protein